MTDHSPTTPKGKQVKILDPILANQIAAGEVVERPASAIKELLENALDAGSTDITVEIREGGRALMRVSDNGHGMDKDDALLALERHATSKISEVNDLNEIITLGFRGEALPSIASVSRLQLLTRTAQAKSATLIRVEGGKAPQVSEGAGRIGTEVRVEDLFFNVPARRKFLKSGQTESGIIHEGVQRLALAYPEVAFKFIKDDHVSLELPQHKSSLERIRALFGARTADHLCPVAWTGPVRLTGFVSHPSFHFSAHRHAYTFINGRFVKDRLFLGAIQRAFGQKLPRGRYPFYLLHLDIHPSLVDVNVHPAKTQVRFVNEEALLDVLTKAFKAAMSEMNFEDSNRSWREKVVDQSALDSDAHPRSSNLQQSPAITLRKASQKQVSSLEQDKVIQSLEVHRTRIQERLRRRLHGDEIDLDTLAESTQLGGSTSDLASQADGHVQKQSLETVSSKEVSLLTDVREALHSRSDRVIKQVPRHDVIKVTQGELEAWRQSGEPEQRSSIDPQEELQSPSLEQEINQTEVDMRESNESLVMPEAVHQLMNAQPLVDERRQQLPPLNSLHELEARRSLRAVGRADDWWIQEAADGLVLVHLPSARVHALTDRPEALRVSEAIQLNLGSAEVKELEQREEELRALGVSLEPFGGSSYRLVTLPKGLETDLIARVTTAIQDTLSTQTENLKVAWARALLSLPLSAEGRAFTLQWLDESGAPDPDLPPFVVTLGTQELMRRCEHLSPF